MPINYKSFFSHEFATEFQIYYQNKFVAQKNKDILIQLLHKFPGKGAKTNPNFITESGFVQIQYLVL